MANLDRFSSPWETGARGDSDQGGNTVCGCQNGRFLQNRKQLGARCQDAKSQESAWAAIALPGQDLNRRAAVSDSSKGWQRKDWDQARQYRSHEKRLPATVPVFCAFHFTFTVRSPPKNKRNWPTIELGHKRVSSHAFTVTRGAASFPSWLQTRARSLFGAINASTCQLVRRAYKDPISSYYCLLIL